MRLRTAGGAEFGMVLLSDGRPRRLQAIHAGSSQGGIPKPRSFLGQSPYCRYCASIPRLIRTMATPSTKRTDPGLGQSDSNSETASAIFHWAALGGTTDNRSPA